MERQFLGDDFFLGSRAARRLYHEHAADMPIFDFHCHLPVQDIAENRRFRNITEIWLGGDHYKWRAMRACGVPERLITGDATDEEKFAAWAETVPATIGNPLYLWTHLELKRYFGISGKLLGPDTAREIYQTCSSMLSGESFGVRGLLHRMRVRVVCTTDDPADSLEHHARLSADASFDMTVAPAFRPDGVMMVEDPVQLNSWIDRLEKAAGQGGPGLAGSGRGSARAPRLFPPARMQDLRPWNRSAVRGGFHGGRSQLDLSCRPKRREPGPRGSGPLQVRHPP